MSIDELDFAEPFFPVKLIEEEREIVVRDKCIVLNLSERPIRLRNQELGHLQSAIFANTPVRDIEKAVLVERFADYPDEGELFRRVRSVRPSAFDLHGGRDAAARRRTAGLNAVATEADFMTKLLPADVAFEGPFPPLTSRSARIKWPAHGSTAEPITNAEMRPT